MDIFSHGLYGGAFFGRRSRLSYWLAFFFGIAPDLFSFGLFFAMNLLGITERPDWSSGHPAEEMIPSYIHTMYDWTHSLVIFAIVFAIVWLIRRKPLYEMLGWPLHILVDIPTHSTEFFATPFLWPISDYKVNGHNWSSPEIFIPNVIILVSLYLWYFVIKPRRKKIDEAFESKA